jgi:threonyl-tRNA synthetase
MGQDEQDCYSSEVKKMSDHREIGQKLDLFMFSQLSPGCPIWLPKGMQVYNSLLNRIRSLNEKNNHLEVRTPIIWKSELYKVSGHLDHYADNMFFVGGCEDGFDPSNEHNFIEIENCIKPMNCPGHMEVFRSKHWSYRDLPIGFAEYSPLHRNEVSGAIGGLTRCRCFCQDDAHVFCTPETLQDEIKKILLMVDEVYSNWFGMEYHPVLSTRPNKFMGDINVWNNAEKALSNALNENEFKFDIAPGDGAFYGPKIDFIVKDALAKEWQTATIQLDFQLPERFNLEFTNKDNHPERPIVIHRAIFGSFERFIAILLESLQGKLPFWLAPNSVRMIPISDKFLSYAKKVQSELQNIGVRCDVDDSNNTTSQKVLVAHTQQIPCLAIVGGREETSNTVTLRQNDAKQETLNIQNFLVLMKSMNS